MVMEFVEGGNLREILKIRKRLTVPELLRILEDAASGLAYAFSRGVTHRDIKLSNLLMSSQGTIKLVDFGLARLFQTAQPDHESDAQVDRTVDYAGLEKATNVKAGDVRSDIYFLGCVAYQLLAGRSALELTRSRTGRMKKSRFSSVVPLRAEQIGTSPAIVQLIESMMAFEPSLRFQTPAQLLDAVRTLRGENHTGPAFKETAPAAARAAAARTLFIVEKSTRLQDALRQGFKKLGFRVFMSTEPDRALDRFHQLPYDALLIDAATVGEEGRKIFEKILAEARGRTLPAVGILILANHQAGWAKEIPTFGNLAVVVRPITIRQLNKKLQELLPRR
jgi:hypothetical protein